MRLTPPLPNFLRRFVRAREGATAVEFAMVATPFFMLIFGVLQLGMVMLISSSMDGALFESSRLVRTGQVSSLTATSPAAIKTSLCSQLSWLGSTCNSSVNIDVRSFASFSAVSAPNSKNGTTASKMCWDTGGPGSVVLVTAYYPWNLWTPVLDSSLVNLGSTQHLIVSTAVFRNEPFSGSTTTPATCPS